ALEIPKPRWTLYDKVRPGAHPSDEVPLTHQERTFTSPIWYTPSRLQCSHPSRARRAGSLS
ncbi:MAG: DUF3604 domain-containing protein, partial [Lysobacterales bacterium]